MTQRTRLQHVMLAGLLVGSGLMCSPVGADTTVTTLTVKVTVITEPCTINANNPIVVNFGDSVLTSKVDGSNYAMPVNYTLDCSGASNDNLKMTISGTGTGFGQGAYIQGNQPHLGIKILSNGDLMPLNYPLNFNRNSPPVLQAVPVKNPAGTLAGGPIEASATMTVEYQ
ncbi:fimbrial protein [Klebsiella aerogenes]|nr:fimbrial protein [Klebsiella aerogenes]